MEKTKVEKIVNELKERLDSTISESSTKRYFPWEDVMASMLEEPDKIRMLDDYCPDCGNRYIEMYFSSPAWTWQQLCGRAGTMKLCCNCPKQEDFRLEIMN